MWDSILVVDDEESIRDAMRRIIKAFGIAKEFYAAKNAVEGWELFQRLSPSVVVTDFHMEGESGKWLADKIKAARPGTRVWIYSGNATREECGEHSLIEKPVMDIRDWSKILAE